MKTLDTFQRRPHFGVFDGLYDFFLSEKAWPELAQTLQPFWQRKAVPPRRLVKQDPGFLFYTHQAGISWRHEVGFPDWNAASFLRWRRLIWFLLRAICSQVSQIDGLESSTTSLGSRAHPRITHTFTTEFSPKRSRNLCVFPRTQNSNTQGANFYCPVSRVTAHYGRSVRW